MDAALALMEERFGKDSTIALATTGENGLSVRFVDGYYENGSFYVVTHIQSQKMRDILKNPAVALCGEWFTGHGTGDSLGWVKDEANAPLAKKLREVFSAWYANGDVNEDDLGTVILRIRLTDGVLCHKGTRYELQF